MRFPCVARFPTLAAAFFASLALIGCPGASVDSDRGPQSLPALEEPDLIGCLDCEGPEMLSVLYLSLDANGTVYVLDRYEPFVRVFGSGGELLRAFGVAGQGPGELGIELPYEYLPGIGVYPWDDGSVLVHEAIPATLTAFDSSGVFTEEVNLEMPVRVPRAAAWNPPQKRLFMLSFLPGQGSQVDRFDLAGHSSAPAQTVLLLSDAFPPTDDEPPWPATPLSMAPTPTGGFALGDPWRYSIRLFGPEGELDGEIVRDIERPKKSDADLWEQREALRQRAAQTGNLALEPHPEASHFTHGALDFDDGGRLWVATTRGVEGTTVFDLFTPEGGYLGEAVMPATLETGSETLRAFAVAGGRLAAVVVGETGDNVIRVWRVVWP